MSTSNIIIHGLTFLVSYSVKHLSVYNLMGVLQLADVIGISVLDIQGQDETRERGGMEEWFPR